MQIQARNLSQHITMPLASSLQAVWVGPEQLLPLQLCLWFQEGDFVSADQKARGGNVFRYHLQRGRLSHSYLLTS